MIEYYIYSVPVFTMKEEHSLDVPSFCEQVEEVLPRHLLRNVDVVYIGEFRELQGRSAAYLNGGIYMTSAEPTVVDMVENFVHEVAHSLETDYASQIYDNDLIREFKGKRFRLRSILDAAGYKISSFLYDFTEYNKKFDEFLANEVGYPTLLTLTMGLFVSPYGATSIQEYFANGFEKYYLDNSRTVKKISPVLHRKIEEIINDDA